MVDRQRHSTSLPARNKFTLKPRDSNRFLPLTTRIQESGPVIDPSYFPEFRESNVERYKDTVSNQAILPVDDYCDISEPSNYLYQLDMPECHLVDSVPATPLFPDDHKLELSQIYESVPVNYEYEISHFYWCEVIFMISSSILKWVVWQLITIITKWISSASQLTVTSLLQNFKVCYILVSFIIKIIRGCFMIPVRHLYVKTKICILFDNTYIITMYNGIVYYNSTSNNTLLKINFVSS